MKPCKAAEVEFSDGAASTAQLQDEIHKLQEINIQMLSALKLALPLLNDGPPGPIDFDALQVAVARVQNAICLAEQENLHCLP